MAEAPIERVRAVIHDAAREPRESEEWVSVEEPLEIRVESPSLLEAARVAVTMRTPGHERELAVGFLFTEGLLSGREALASPSVREALAIAGRSNVITVRLKGAFDPSALQRNFYATSSCGVCGKASIDQVEREVRAITSELAVDRALIEALPEKLRAARDGALRCVREDVGRHNAMDKALGRMVLQGAVPLDDCVVMVSGRLSFELVQKVAMAGAPVLCAVSAPSSLAIDAARRFGVTLVGFVRDRRCTVYAHGSRVR
jgi:FdhD protein